MFAIILCCFFVTLLKDGKLLCLESFQIAFIFKMKRFFFVYACLCESKERRENEKKEGKWKELLCPKNKITTK